jgi:hypothetical protein
MKNMNIKEEIFHFISTHEAIITHEIHERDENIEVKFTTFGSKAGCKALYDVIQMLDDDTKIKVLEMMKNKRVE